MNKYPKQLTKEEGLELRRMRKEAGIPIPKIAEYMCILIHQKLVI